MRPGALLLATVLLGGCAAHSADGDDRRPDNDGPSPITLLANPEVDLARGSSCWAEHGVRMCEDVATVPTENLPVATSRVVRFRFPVDDTWFTATLTPLSAEPRRCRRPRPVHVTRVARRTYALYPSAPAGRYRVSLTARSGSGRTTGDFVWASATNGGVRTGHCG